MATITDPLPKLIVSLDIETTGVYERDPIIAIGICGMTPERDVIYKYKVGRTIRSDEEIQEMINGRMTWADIWIHRGYDIRCFDRFWKTRTDMLDKLQDPSYIQLVATTTDLAFEVNRILKELESVSSEIIIVTNTTAFDTVHVGRILAEEFLQPLHYSRDGRYRWTYHSTSYLLGLWGGVIDEMKTEHWKAFDAWLARKIDDISQCPVAHDHDPENDAYFIGWRWLNANVYAEKKMNKRMSKIASTSN